LWETAIAAGHRNSGLDPSVVIEFVHQAISLVGNASFCGLSDCCKGLLAKISPESLDLPDDASLFGKDSSELFGKKFKKAMLKELKHDKIMDSLVGRGNHSNRHAFFHQHLAKGPGTFQAINTRLGIRAWTENAQNHGWNQSRAPFRSFQQGTRKSYQQKGK
jgi:hypothetical protein